MAAAGMMISFCSASKAPAVDWKEATSDFFANDSRPIMLFDGKCNLCNGGVKFVRDNDSKRYEVAQRKPPAVDAPMLEAMKHNTLTKHAKNDVNMNIRYEALQSEAGRKLLQRSGRSRDDISSVVLVEKDRSFIKADAVLKIMKYLNMPFPQLAVFFQLMPLFIRDAVYDTVAKNRYAIFGESDSCEI